jgi:hypothetical protein
VAINDLRSRREAQGDTPASGVGGGTPPTSERAGRDAVSYRKRPRAGMASDVRKPDRIWHRLPLSVQGVISFRTPWAAHLSPRLNSRNRCSVEGEWFW